MKQFIRFSSIGVAIALGQPIHATEPALLIAPVYAPDSPSGEFSVSVTLTLDSQRCVLRTFSPAASAVAQWQLTSPDGRPIRYAGPEAKIDYATLVRTTDSQGRLSATVRLFDAEGSYFDLSAPGTYLLSLRWTMAEHWRKPEYRHWFDGCRPWFGSVQSNTLPISVRP